MPTASDQARRILAAKADASVPLLRAAGFAEPETASRALDRLAGTATRLTPLPVDLLAAVLESGWPDRALRHLERYVEVTGVRATLWRLVEVPPLRDGLLRLLAHSRFLTDILVRNPELLAWLFESSAHLVHPVGRGELRARLEQELAGAGDNQRGDALRRFQRRELLRIGAAEVLACKDVDRVGRELADLADVTVAAALEGVQGQLCARYGRPRSARGRPALFTVVGLGKYGGRELNFSSDIDLIFVYDEEGRTGADDEPGVDNALFFDRLAEGLIQVLTQVTGEGFLYRVDMRLRPEGDRGPLTRALRSHWIYYETRGELWERQMLLKARRAAGSSRLWQRYRAMLAPFIHPTHFAASPREAIRRVKERIEANIRQRPGGGNNIKLRVGGIRDIEFVVQCLQLLSGRPSTPPRPGTLPAIEGLRQAGTLRAPEADTLGRAYRFLRRVENLLQIDSGRATYAVPDDGTPEACLLARALGLDAETPRAAVDRHCAEVRAIYDDLFYGDEQAVAGAAPEGGMAWLLEARPASQAAARHLEALGFGAGAEAHRVLLQLGAHPMLTAAGRDHLEALLDELLPQLGGTPDADAGLVRFARIVDGYGAPGAFYGMALSHPRFLTMLVTVCGSSALLADLLQHDPGLLDRLVSLDMAAAIPAPAAATLGDLAALKRYRDAALLRIGVDDLLGLTASEETFHRLSDVADAVVAAVVDHARGTLAQRRGRPRTRARRDARFSCLVGGKAGGRELDFASDLDLFFVYEGEGHTGRGYDNAEFFAELARGIIGNLGGLFEVDARLRPEGRSAPVVISLAGYRRYLRERGATWERLALSRARVVAGDADLGARVVRAVEAFVFSTPVDAALVDEVVDMRRRMEPQPVRGRLPALDIKRGAGGLVDIEFIAQVLVLAHGRAAPRLRQTNTRLALEGMVEAAVLGRDEGRRLLLAYERLRQVHKALRLAGRRGGNVLPAPGAELEVLARAVGAASGRGLAAELDDLCGRTRADFESVMGRVQTTAGADR